MAARIPDWRRVRAGYPRQVTIPPRFADLDPLDHLNNIAIARIFEEGRVRLLMDMFGPKYRADGVRVVTAESTVRYFAEGNFPEPLNIASGILTVRRSSYVIAQAMFQSGRLLSSCDAVHVNTAAGGGATPLSDWMRERLLTALIHVPSTSCTET